MTSTTETAPMPRLLERSGARFSWRRAAAAFAVTVAVIAIFAIAFFLSLSRLHDGRVMPGVRVNGVSLAGLDRGSAEARLREALPSLSGGSLVLSAGDVERRVSFAELGRDYDIPRILDAAFAVGRSGTPIDQAADQTRSLLRGTAVDLGMTYDPSAVERHVASAAGSADRPAVDATVTTTPSGFTVTPAVDGREVDREATIAASARAVDSLSSDDARIEMPVRPVAPAITTAEAEAAAARAEQMTGAPLVVQTGGQPVTIPSTTLRTWISFAATADGGYAPALDATRIGAATEELRGNVGARSKNATYAFASKTGKAVRVVPGAAGKELDVPGSANLIIETLTGRTASSGPSTVRLAVTEQQPDFTTEEAEALLPKIQRVSTWTTRYPVSERNFWGRNISVPTTVINGYVVDPGATFDFWKVVGEVSPATGYGPGGVIINGKNEPTGALAGGICSCSTTIFNSALRYGLEIGDRRNHYYYISRYPVGLDATVFKSGTGRNQTMSFTNDTEYPILIRGINGRGTVRFDLYSVANGRKTTFSRPSISRVVRARESIVYTNDLRPGQKRRTDYPINGFDSVVTRTVRDGSGKVLHQDTFFSRYAALHGIVEVGRAPGDPPAGTQVFVGG